MHVVSATGLTQMQLKKSLEKYQIIPKSVMVQHIGVGAGKLLGVRMIFAVAVDCIALKY